MPIFNIHKDQENSGNDQSQKLLALTIAGNVSQADPDSKEDTLPCYRLSAQIGPQDIDDPAPVIIIMFPDKR